MSDAPSPHGAASVEELSARLRALQAWAGVPYREVHRRVVARRRARGMVEVPAYNTVYRCLRPGRVRLDVELVVDIATVLLGANGAAVEWRQAHQAILGLADEAAIVGVADTLPDDLAAFTGRRAERAAVAAAVAEAGGVVVVSGMPGVGKTRLAVRIGHDLVRGGRFSGVRLSVNLRGHDPARPPADPAAVLEAFLRRLGVAGERIHGMDLSRRAATYRELLGGRRALVVLDNAATEDQVRPLLPGDDCVVLVTSRQRLDGLPATVRVALDVFTPAESLDLLRRTVDRRRVDADVGTAARIAQTVGHLPLAVGLVAGRIAAQPAWTLADHLDRLVQRRTVRRLDDRVELAIGLSYDGLEPAPRRLFRLLALHPGEELDAYAAAALARCDLGTAQRQLDALLAANLVLQRVSGRYGLHDSVRVYATNRAHDDDPGRARTAALTRLLDHLLHTAATAADWLAPHERHRRPMVPNPGTPTPTFDGPDTATAWLDTHRPTLIAAALFAADNGLPTHTSRFSAILFRYLDTGGHHTDAETLHGRAAEAGTDADRAVALTNLGTVHWRLGRHTAALEHQQRALALHRACGERGGEARALSNLGMVHDLMGHYPEALDHHQRALEIYRALGDRAGVGRALNNLALVNDLLGCHEDAIDQYRQGLALSHEAGDRVSEAIALTNIGVVYGGMGRHDDAAEHHRLSLDVFRRAGDRASEGRALNNIGDASSRLGQHDEAVEHHHAALAVLRGIGDREGEVDVLNSLGHTLRRAGSHTDALDRHREALAAADELGDPYERARAHDGIARCAEATGDRAAAREHWTAALALFTDLGTPERTTVAERLRRL